MCFSAELVGAWAAGGATKRAKAAGHTRNVKASGLAPLPNGMPALQVPGTSRPVAEEPTLLPQKGAFKPGAAAAADTKALGSSSRPWHDYWAAAEGERDLIAAAAEELGVQELAALDPNDLRSNPARSMHLDCTMFDTVHVCLHLECPLAGPICPALLLCYVPD